MQPQPASRESCSCGNVFLEDSHYCRKCGRKRPGNGDGKDVGDAAEPTRAKQRSQGPQPLRASLRAKDGRSGGGSGDAQQKGAGTEQRGVEEEGLQLLRRKAGAQTSGSGSNSAGGGANVVTNELIRRDVEVETKVLEQQALVAKVGVHGFDPETGDW